MGRAPCCDKSNVKKGPWSPEEDAKLKAYIEEHGTGGNWIALPQKIGLKRCGKSCRLRWLNYLRPNIKHGGFSEEEDQIIISLYISIGSRWSIIAAQLQGRTDNDIKNYWNTRLKKKLLGKSKESPQSRCLPVNRASNEAANAMSHETHSQTLRAYALERMQLHMQLQGPNNPALWPKYHPLGDKILESQHIDAISTTLVPQHDSDGTVIESSHQSLLQVKHEIQSSMSRTVQEDMDCSTLGFCSPSSTGGLSVENPYSDYRSQVAGFQPDIHEILFHGKSSSFRLQEENQLAGLDCFKGMYAEKESMSWWSSTGFEEKVALGYSASSLQPDSMLQEYVLGYDL